MTRSRLSRALLVLAIAATAIAADQRTSFILQSGETTWMDGGRDFDQSALRAKYGDHFAAFTRDGRTYVITNAAVLERIEKVYQPVVDLARQQAVLGSKQASLGSQQAHLGAQQAQLAAEQAAHAMDSDRNAQSEVNAKQRELRDGQHALGDEQQVLAAKQKALGQRQRELSRESAPKLERIFTDAIASGAATDLR